MSRARCSAAPEGRGQPGPRLSGPARADRNEAVLSATGSRPDPVTMRLCKPCSATSSMRPRIHRIPGVQLHRVGYNDFKTATRTAPVLYVAANDGYLHARPPTDATGTDNKPTCPPCCRDSPVAGGKLAYMPKFVMPGGLPACRYAYANAHRFMLDGSPESATCSTPRPDLEDHRRRRQRRRPRILPRHHRPRIRRPVGVLCDPHDRSAHPQLCPIERRRHGLQLRNP